MITSSGNNRIRELIKLKKSAKERSRRDVFLVEGPKMFREVPRHLLEEVYVSESFLKTGEGRALSNAADTKDMKIESVSDPVFRQLSDTQSPQGILAVVRQLRYEMKDLFGDCEVTPSSGCEVVSLPTGDGEVMPSSGCGEASLSSGDGKATPLLVILEDLQDPGNLGTILRTAEAAGATGIILSRGSADVYNPKVTRSTMGSIFRVPFLYTDSLSDSIRELQKKGVKIFAAHLKGSTEMFSIDCRGPAAFLIGNESRGLSDATAALADGAVRIPMSGKVESLNAAVAASLLLYEAKRQRL